MRLFFLGMKLLGAGAGASLGVIAGLSVAGDFGYGQGRSLHVVSRRRTA